MSARLSCPPVPGPPEAFAVQFDPLFQTPAQRFAAPLAACAGAPWRAWTPVEADLLFRDSAGRCRSAPGSKKRFAAFASATPSVGGLPS